jgi:hypothetical protein
MYILMGIIILKDKIIKDQFREYDFSQYNLHFIVGWGIIIHGIFMLISLYKQKKLNNKTEYSKCPKCKTAYNYQDLENGICPKCHIQTIEMEEYFKQFPKELKKK